MLHFSDFLYISKKYVYKNYISDHIKKSQTFSCNWKINK